MLRTTTLTTLSLVALAGAPAAHAVTWGPVTPVPGAPARQHITGAAVNAEGDAAVAYTSAYVAQDALIDAHVSVKPAGGAFGPPLLIGQNALGYTSYRFTMAIAPDGGVATLAQFDGENDANPFQLRTAAPGATALSAPVAVTPAGGTTPDQPGLAVGRDGSVTAAWRDDDRAAWGVGTAGGAFPPGQAASTASGDAAFAGDEDGDAIVAYPVDPNDGTYTRGAVRVRIRRAGGTFGPEQTVSPAGIGFADQPVVAMGPGGHVAIAWTERTRITENDSAPTALELAQGTAAGGLGAPVQVEPPTNNPNYFQGLALAENGSGDLVLAWTRGGPKDSTPMHFDGLVARAQGGGPLGPVVPFPTATVEDVRVDAALAPDGTAVLTYPPTEVSDDVVVAVAEPGAPFTASTVPAGSGRMLVAFGGSERGIAVWNDPKSLAPVYSTLDATGTAPASAPAPASAAPVASPAATALPAPPAPIVLKAAGGAAAPRTSCRVPSLRDLTPARAKARLRSAHCALGRVTTPKKDRKIHGLVIRAQSRRAGSRATAGARVDVTLGVRPKAKKARR
jgi:hypothetical protein